MQLREWCVRCERQDCKNGQGGSAPTFCSACMLFGAVEVERRLMINFGMDPRGSLCEMYSTRVFSLFSPSGMSRNPVKKLCPRTYFFVGGLSCRSNGGSQ